MTIQFPRFSVRISVDTVQRLLVYFRLSLNERRDRFVSKIILLPTTYELLSGIIFCFQSEDHSRRENKNRRAF